MHQQPVRVLLVEDNPEYTLVVKRLLSRADGGRFTMEAAETVAGALERIEALAPDLILLDLTLPDSAGIDTFDRVNRRARTVPIVVLSGNDDDELAMKAMKRGAQDYIVKTRVQKNELVRAMRYAIERKRFEDEIRELNANLECMVAERTSELQEANDRMAKVNKELRDLDRLKSVFIDITSHELRTPLLSIRGMLHVLRRRIPADDMDVRTAVETAIRGARRLETIIARTLDVAHAGSYVRDVIKKDIDVRQMLQAVADLVAPIVELRHLKMGIDVPDDLPTVPAAQEMLRDVLLNLVMNAIKFTPNGGAITLSAHVKNGDMEFSVADTGIGISEEDRPHVFEEFFTTFDAIHHSSGEYGFLKRGIGLGLAIVKNFVELHDGAVWFESVVDDGTTFTFTFPLNPTNGRAAKE